MFSTKPASYEARLLILELVKKRSYVHYSVVLDQVQNKFPQALVGKIIGDLIDSGDLKVDDERNLTFVQQGPKIFVRPITNIRPHPNDVYLRIAEVGGHQVVIGDHYYEGQLGFFIPEGALVPDKIASEMWVLGKLAGKGKNRVKARFMKGVWSEGLFYGSQGASWNPDWRERDEISQEVGIE